MVSPRTNSQLTLFTADTLDFASRSAPQGIGEARQMSATCGLTCCGLCENSNHVGLLVKMLKATLPLDSIPFAMIWRVKVTPSGRSVFQLAPSEQSIAASGCSFWPTPQAMDGMKARPPDAMYRQMTHGGRKNRKKIANMKDVAVFGLQWTGEAKRLGDGELNPQRLEWMQGYRIGWTEIGR